MAASGVPFAVARPSIVLGDHAKGAIRDFPSLCNVFRLMARGKVGVFPTSADATLDLVPLCHVAEGIVRLAERFGGEGQLLRDGPEDPVLRFLARVESSTGEPVRLPRVDRLGG